MPAVDSPMHQAVAQNAVLRISNLLGDRIVREVVAAMEGFVRPARCIWRPVRVVEMKHRFPSSHEKAGPCIVASVTRRKSPLIEVLTVGRAGNLYERSFPQPRRFVRGCTQTVQPQGA